MRLYMPTMEEVAWNLISYIRYQIKLSPDQDKTAKEVVARYIANESEENESEVRQQIIHKLVSMLKTRDKTIEGGWALDFATIIYMSLVLYPEMDQTSYYKITQDKVNHLETEA